MTDRDDELVRVGVALLRATYFTDDDGAAYDNLANTFGIWKIGNGPGPTSSGCCWAWPTTGEPVMANCGCGSPEWLDRVVLEAAIPPHGKGER